MINDEKNVQKITADFKARIVRNCDLASALEERNSLIKRKNQLEGTIGEYKERNASLSEKDKALGVEIASMIADCKNPDALSKKRRDIKLEVEDLSSWISESENLLDQLKPDIQQSSAQLHRIIDLAAAQEYTQFTDVLNNDLKEIEDKIESFYQACFELSTEYEITNIQRRFLLNNHAVKHCIA